MFTQRRLNNLRDRIEEVEDQQHRLLHVQAVQLQRIEEIDVFPGQALANELSGNVVDLCPVGALLDKDFLFAQRVWFLKETPSIDGLTASGDNISIHHNDGKRRRRSLIGTDLLSRTSNLIIAGKSLLARAFH